MIEAQSVEELRREHLPRLPFSPQVQSLFFDKADTHTLSDWLMAYAWGVGLVDPDEFHLGGLPDLTSVLERSDQRIIIKEEELHWFARRPLKMGRIFRKIFKNRIFIDLGCGKIEKSPVPRILAEFYGSQFYIGVDLIHNREQVLRDEFCIQDGFRSYFIKSDLSDFISACSFSEPKVFLLSGIEGITPDADEIKAYRKSLVDKLEIQMKKCDYLILGAGTFDLELSKKKFSLIYSDPYHEIFRFKRNFFGINF